jgi:uncharacterized membrane-anchored protein YjiN (DUF445 family)
MNFQYPPQPQSSHPEGQDKLNEQKMSYICDEIINILKFMRQNKDIYNQNKDEMLRMIKSEMPNFYTIYPRICRALVFEDDISPLLGMIQTFGKVQNKELSWEKANNMITTALNAKYVDPVLNSDKLVKEREEKQKSNVIDITNSN